MQSRTKNVRETIFYTQAEEGSIPKDFIDETKYNFYHPDDINKVTEELRSLNKSLEDIKRVTYKIRVIVTEYPE